jgi:hypothetical protein
MLALLGFPAMLGTEHGCSTASPSQSGSAAPALPKAVTRGQQAVRGTTDQTPSLHTNKNHHCLGLILRGARHREP